MTTKRTTATQLRAAIEATFPPSAKCWSQATDEVRDMSRHAREILDLDDSHALNFRVIKTPGQWNTQGINSIIRFYELMTDKQRTDFIDANAHLYS